MADNVTGFPFGSAAAADWPTGGSAAGANSAAGIGQYGTAQTGNSEYWLPIWSGEVLTAYDQYNIFEPLVTTRAIASGTTMRFPITGTVGHKAQWKAGEELEGSATISSPQWFDISLDERPMASYFELDDIALMLTQWEYRSELARQAGLSLANARDKQIACLIAQAAFMPARNPAMSTGGNFASAGAGDNLTAATYDMPAHAEFNHLGHASAAQADRSTAALKLLEYIERYMVRLQKIDAPTSGVYVAVNPQAFNDIRALGIARSTSDAANMQPMFGGVAAAGGLGAPYSTGMNALTYSLQYMGATIVKTNHLLEGTVELDKTPATYACQAASAAGEIDTELGDVVGDPTGATAFAVAAAGSATETAAQYLTDIGDAKYNFDWNRFGTAGTVTGSGYSSTFPVKSLIWQQDAVASLSLQGMKVDSVRDVRRNTNFTVASVMRGGGVLRPEMCAAICGSDVV